MSVDISCQHCPISFLRSRACRLHKMWDFSREHKGTSGTLTDWSRHQTMRKSPEVP